MFMLAMTRQLVTISIDVGIVVLVLGFLLCLGRLLRGPHLADRALAMDIIAVHLIGMVVLFTLRINSMALFDGILVLSLIGVVGTLAVAQYIARPHVGRRRKRDGPPKSDR
jgi:multisubunit Na+/H+ antiporter MnhF subunit